MVNGSVIQLTRLSTVRDTKFRSVAKKLSTLLKEARTQRGLTQDEVAKALGMTKGNYNAMETGKRKSVLEPDLARSVARVLRIPMLELVVSMGYAVEIPGVPDAEEAQLLQDYRSLSLSLQRVLRAAIREGTTTTQL